MKTTINHEKLILALIKDDLINYKLVSGLMALGVDAGDYFLGLSDTVFELLGIKENEALFEQYLNLLRKGKTMNVTNKGAALEKLAKSIYRELTAAAHSHLQL